MAKKDKTHQNVPYQQGIREFFGKKYIWLLNHEGKLELHALHRPIPADTTPVEEDQ
jgi:hypothetical protein